MPREAYVFPQFLRLLPRYEFQRIVNKYNGDYRAKRFKCWHQLACMMFAHIRQENSLRDIDIALNAHANKLYQMALRLTPVSLAEIMGTWAGRSIRKAYGSSADVSPHCGPASTT